MNSEDFLNRVSANIVKRKLLSPGKPVIVAISGGADSVALLSSLHRLGYECIAAHCNYHLRGEESNRDMRYAQQLCSTLGVDLYVRDCDVASRQKAAGESLEMACRALRYSWFHDLLDRLRAQAIAVGHHREDNLETFFINLSRGSGISGLGGIRWRNEYIVRPLLNFTRQEIEEYLKEESLDYVVDSTNLQNDYVRNRWRNQVLPTVEGLMPGALDGIYASLTYLEENRDFYEDVLNEKAEKYFQDKRIDLHAITKHERYPRLVLHKILEPFGYNFTQIDNILASAQKSGLEFIANGSRIELSRGILQLILEDAPSSQGAVEVSLRRDILSPINISISEHAVAEFKPSKDGATAFFDKNILLDNPHFELRHWARGDRMAPYGMHGDTRLVSDIFATAKLSAEAKRSAWLLIRNGEIVWIVGLRASNLFTIGPETKRFLRLELK